MSDLISRQAAIEALQCKKEHKKAKDYEDCSYCIWNDVCRCGKKSKEVNADDSTNDT